MLKLTIRTDNAAFEGDPREECARILREVATSLERGTSGMPLHDFNGNQVGRFDLTRNAGPLVSGAQVSARPRDADDPAALSDLESSALAGLVDAYGQAAIIAHVMHDAAAPASPIGARLLALIEAELRDGYSDMMDENPACIPCDVLAVAKTLALLVPDSDDVEAVCAFVDGFTDEPGEGAPEAFDDEGRVIAAAKRLRAMIGAGPVNADHD